MRGYSYSANRERFIHGTEGFTFMLHRLTATLGSCEITCFNVKIERQITRSSGAQFEDMQYRWSALGFSLWLPYTHGRRPRRAAQALKCHPEGHTAINS